MATIHTLVREMVLRLLVVNSIILSLAMAAPPSSADAADRPLRIIAFGDSLTAGFGLQPEQSFPAQLERALKTKGADVEIVNAGVSGDTTAGGLARLDWSIPDDADAVILELGANDALQGRPPAQARANLDAMLARLTKRGLPVLLAGMQAPRNLGLDYTRAFDSIYPDLAAKHGVMLYPFFLDGVALDPELNQRDGIHPTAEGVSIIVSRMAPKVLELIAAARARVRHGG